MQRNLTLLILPLNSKHQITGDGRDIFKYFSEADWLCLMHSCDIHNDIFNIDIIILHL